MQRPDLHPVWNISLICQHTVYANTLSHSPSLSFSYIVLAPDPSLPAALTSCALSCAPSHLICNSQPTTHVPSLSPLSLSSSLISVVLRSSRSPPAGLMCTILHGSSRVKHTCSGGRGHCLAQKNRSVHFSCVWEREREQERCRGKERWEGLRERATWREIYFILFCFLWCWADVWCLSNTLCHRNACMAPEPTIEVIGCKKWNTLL